MFVKVVKNTKGRKGTSFIYLCESYREDGKIKHRTLRALGLFDDDQVPYIKAAFANPKPKLVYESDSQEDKQNHSN
jgi:hypothetical protein